MKNNKEDQKFEIEETYNNQFKEDKKSRDPKRLIYYEKLRAILQRESKRKQKLSFIKNVQKKVRDKEDKSK